MGLESRELSAKNKVLMKFIGLFIYSIIMLLFSFGIVNVFEIENIFGLPAVVIVFIISIILYPILKEVILLFVVLLIPSSNRLAFLRGQRHLYNEEQINQFKIGAKNKIDPSIYANPDFDDRQMDILRLGLKANIDVSIYAKKEYNWLQMEQIRLGLEDNIDVSVYAKVEMSWREMERIRKKLENEQ